MDGLSAESEAHDTFGGELAVDRCPYLEASEASAHPANFRFDTDGLSCRDASFELGGFDRSKVNGPASILFGVEHENRADLRHRFRENGRREKGTLVSFRQKHDSLVYPKLADDSFPGLDLADGIDEEKRLAMREDALYLLAIEKSGHVGSRRLSQGWKRPPL